MLHRLPVGDVKEDWSGISPAELRDLVEGLRRRDFCGYVELRWPDCEGALILSGDGKVFAVFQADAVDLRGPEALRHIVTRAGRVQPRARVVALPHTLGPLLGALSELQPLHVGLHTRFVDLERLAARLAREGFSGLVLLEGEGWWGFLPFGDDTNGNGAVYYDGSTVMGRQRGELIEGLVGVGAEIEVWVSPVAGPRPVEFEPPASEPEQAAATPSPAPEQLPAPPQVEPTAAPQPGWQAYKGSETFVAVPALTEADEEGGPLGELRERFGQVAVELARRLDGTRTLEEVREELGRPCAELEPILLYLQQRKWMARYFRRRGPQR
ncbi:MAG: hypothetical protein RMM30_02340 [Armatimonadota bacterium]|nr:hypothetical protein [Armatimonadota bacterium]MDW8155411.1 hypothetical protein [Armatimonadota bacterium]